MYVSDARHKRNKVRRVLEDDALHFIILCMVCTSFLRQPLGACAWLLEFYTITRLNIGFVRRNNQEDVLPE